MLWLFAFGILQVLLGGTLSGMKAALLYPTWPLMYSEWIPSLLLEFQHWKINNFLLYDQSGFMPALIQFLHRMNGYFLLILIFIFAFNKIENSKLRTNTFYLLGIIVAQILLGIATLINSKGQIPVFYGVAHQAFGILSIGFLFYLVISTKKSIVAK